ncbi:MAG: hypothetical protein ABWY38_06665 [Methyloceanibacter sp.]
MTRAGLSVLLAEDNDINALLARTVLEKAGARVVRARNGADAVARVQDALANRQRFELVLGRSILKAPAQANHGRRSWRSPPRLC